MELVFSATLVLSGCLLNGLALYGMAVTHDTSNALYLTTAKTFKSALAKAIAHATRACQGFVDGGLPYGELFFRVLRLFAMRLYLTLGYLGSSHSQPKKVSRYAVHTITFRLSLAAHTTIRSITLDLRVLHGNKPLPVRLR